MDWLVSISILTIPAAVAMGIVRLFGVTRWWMLLLAAIAGGALAGVFIGSAASAMASAFDPRDAMLRGGLIGVVSGFITAGVILLAAAGFANMRK